MHRGNRRVILTTVRYYLPGFKSGGPIRTIANMVDRLGDEFQFRIITADRDALDDVPYANAILGAWNSLGKARVYYIPERIRSARLLIRLIKETPHDLLYLNSFFNPVFTWVPLVARSMGLIPKRPVVIAPRGEFSPGALALKPWKKVVFQKISQQLGIYDGLLWQASSPCESADIRRVMGSSAGRIAIAPNVSPAPSAFTPEPKKPALQTSDALRIVFLSRIDPMKNLRGALEILTRANHKVIFHIYGPIEGPNYWRECRSVMAGLPPRVRVEYKGAVPHERVHEILAQYDLFFLPTFGENFGHVILEAWLSGCPVLLSDQTPWRDLASKGIGWDLPLSEPNRFLDAIETMARMGQAERNRLSQQARRYALHQVENADTIGLNRRLFLEACAPSSEH